MCAMATKKAKATQPRSASQKNKSDACCAPSPLQSRSSPQKQASSQNAKNANNRTKVIVKFDCGFKNNLAIRGEGIKGLSWNKGTPLKNTKADEWCWETNDNFKQCRFKVLINDTEYELGDDHSLECGKSIVFVPQFNKQ